MVQSFYEIDESGRNKGERSAVIQPRSMFKSIGTRHRTVKLAETFRFASIDITEIQFRLNRVEIGSRGARPDTWK